MTSHPTSRVLATLTAAAVLATMSTATVASPVSAAKPKCQGFKATIVGTDKADRIVGTRKRDVIVAKGGADLIFGRGGNDIICAGSGNDRIVGNAGIDRLIAGAGADTLFGGVGPDRLFGGPGPDTITGQPGNDVIDGGLGIDTCYQGSGTGPVVRCELPPAAVLIPVAPPPPPPSPKVLAIAYSDLDKNSAFGPGDVMISRIVDTNGDGRVSVGDTIEMGRYPTTLTPTTAADFAYWEVKSHIIGKVHSADPDELEVWTGTDPIPNTIHVWYSESISSTDQYDEYIEMTAYGGISDLEDKVPAGANDSIEFMQASPSRPSLQVPYTDAPGTGDDYFIDVIFY